MTKRSRSSAADIIQTARKICDETQDIFAIRVGTTQSLLSKYERSKVDPPSDLIIHCMTIIESSRNQPDDIDSLVDKVARLSGPQYKDLRRAIIYLTDQALMGGG